MNLTGELNFTELETGSMMMNIELPVWHCFMIGVASLVTNGVASLVTNGFQYRIAKMQTKSEMYAKYGHAIYF